MIEHNRVLNFSAVEFFYEGPDVAVIELLGQGKLIPPEKESYNHGLCTCKVGMLCVAFGQPHNVQPRDKVRLYDKVALAALFA